MIKKFDSKKDFMETISAITVDGSVTIDLKNGLSEVPKEKQFPYVSEASNMNLQDAIDNLPTALRFELIKLGYSELIKELKFNELDGPADYWPGRMTSYILRFYPEYEEKIDWDKLKNTWLVQVLIDQPQFERKVDFGKIDVRSSAELISKRPDYVKHFNLEVFNSPEYSQYWFKILEKQPQFANQCDWKLINDYQKDKLKQIHPEINIS